jgi:hypothetical protein
MSSHDAITMASGSAPSVTFFARASAARLKSDVSGKKSTFKYEVRWIRLKLVPSRIASSA